ncbi:hypothetical protein FRC17_009107 [Serendipita sp. 399]|nr:hypothetical protein FRC17_009107 [Serendipita sp. 399]
MRSVNVSFMSVVLFAASNVGHAYVTTCQTRSTACTWNTAQEAVAHIRGYLDNFGAQPAGADFYLFTGVISGNDNFATCQATLQSDAYHPGSVQANVTKANFNAATTGMIYSCVLAGKQGNLAFNDTSRFEGPTLWFRVRERSMTTSPSPPPDLILQMEEKLPQARIPPLPELPFNIALQVFTDISLRRKGEDGSSRTDNDVLSVVGQTACITAWTTILYTRDPHLSVDGLTAARDEIMSEKNLLTWINHYHSTMSNVRCLPGIELTPEISIRAWYAYMGGIHLSRGNSVLEAFLRQLLEPPCEQHNPPIPMPLPSQRHGHVPSHSGSMLIPGVPIGQKLDSQGQSISLLHMMATKNAQRVEYDSESSGPRHALIWTVSVLLNGEWKGQGQATSKQVAKEEAAKSALSNLGWL